MRVAKAMFDEAPFMVFWEMTQACDLACRHCRACAVPEPSPLELRTDEAEQLLRDVREMGTNLFVLTGGDPAKRKDLVHLVRYGTELGLRMALTPSATPLVTPEVLSALKDAGLARLAVSLDGASHAAHDDFRRVLGSHRRTFEILETAKALGITTQVNTTVTRFNVADLERMANQIAPLGIELWSVFLVVPTGRATEADVLDPDEVEDVLERLATLAETAPFDVKTTAAPHFRRVLLQRKVKRSEITGIADGIGRAPRGVNDGQGIAFVSHHGDVMPSGFLPIPCGNVRTDHIRDVYRDHPAFRALRDPDALVGKCGDCEFRKVCGGSRARAYAMTGDLCAADPACVYQPRPRRTSTRKRLVVIGAGIAGLTAAYEAQKRYPTADVEVIESTARVGGLVESERTESGLLLEHGADCLSTLKPEAIALARELGLHGELSTTGPASRQTFVVVKGGLKKMPPSAMSFTHKSLADFAVSPLLSVSGKARATLELAIAPRTNDRDESVASFVERRFGAEVLARIVEPLVTGIYGASPRVLSADIVLPRLRLAERRFGSVTASVAIESAAPPPAMWTLTGGMETLPRALLHRLGEKIRTGIQATSVNRTPDGRWGVELDNGAVLETDAVIIATPAWVAGKLLHRHHSRLAAMLTDIPSSGLSMVTLAWPRTAISHALEGTGFVVPECEGLALRSCTWLSRKWNERAPAGIELMRCFLRDTSLPEEVAIRVATAELSTLLGIREAPAFAIARRRQNVLPIYAVGHAARRDEITTAVQAQPGLALAGNYLDGVGIGDVVCQAKRAVEQVRANLTVSVHAHAAN